MKHVSLWAKLNCKSAVKPLALFFTSLVAIVTTVIQLICVNIPSALPWNLPFSVSPAHDSCPLLHPLHYFAATCVETCPWKWTKARRSLKWVCPWEHKLRTHSRLSCCSVMSPNLRLTGWGSNTLPYSRLSGPRSHQKRIKSHFLRKISDTGPMCSENTHTHGLCCVSKITVVCLFTEAPPSLL